MTLRKLYPEVCLMHIMEIIRDESTVAVEALTELFVVSGATIRTELRELE
jgi:DeoR/GlpR family transcriptional regulator of sugar metabolism